MWKMTNRKEYFKNRYDTFKANHQCVICGCELEKDTKIIKCKFCSKKAYMCRNELTAKRKDAGVCIECGGELTGGSKNIRCAMCIEKNKKRGNRK